MPARHAVVDGSNIATEGRSQPSLAQLNEAVEAFRNDMDFEHITVIVDATFAYRVSEDERDKARAAINANEIITPPAGVIGRGDAFILQVADRANAAVLSNDSFQEFHGTYKWLFDEGRLIGGKPVPGLGWIYVPRSPIRGPVSREATRSNTAAVAKKAPTPAAKKPAAATAKKTPTPAAAKKPAAATAKKTPTPAAAKKPAAATAKKTPTPAAAKKPAATAKKTPTPAAAKKPAARSNTVRAWKSFRQQHPVGTSVRATVESFSSHGAYASADGIAIYLPLSLLADPAPRRSRDAVSLGETRQFLIHRYVEELRGIDAGLVPVVDQPVVEAAAKKRSPRRR